VPKFLDPAPIFLGLTRLVMPAQFLGLASCGPFTSRPGLHMPLSPDTSHDI